MRKGKLGVVVCLYPILGFVCVILNQPLLCALIFGFVLVAERDEWAGRQCLQAVGLSAIAVVLRELLVYSVNLFPVYIDFSISFPPLLAPSPLWYTWLPSSPAWLPSPV